MEIREADLIRMQSQLEGITDPRRKRGNLRHKLTDMLVIALSTIVIGENDFEAMEDWGREREDWLRTFLELPNGIPDQDTFRRLFERINPAEALGSLSRWLFPGEAAGIREVNIDGKTIRVSGKAGEHKAPHVVSARVGEQDLVLGQVATEEKSKGNEVSTITAIPQLPDLIDLRGATVTIDAMGCQTAIAERIRARQGQYILSVKENQPNLYRDIRDYFEYLEEKACPQKAADEWTGEIEKDHGRIERRSVSRVTEPEWLESAPDWKDLSAVIRYRCSRTVGQECTITDRYYITSLKEDAKTLGPNIRGHWSIENHPHWSLDVLFQEDACQVRKDHAPENLNILRKIALARLRSAVVPQKRFSTKRKVFKAGVNPDFLYSVLFGK